LDEAKGRLASVLSPLERAALTLAMLEDVLDATLLLPGWETWVVSPDESVLEVAAARGATPMPEEQPPLAQAIRQAEEEALARHRDAFAVLLPDTPLVTAAALTRAAGRVGSISSGPRMCRITSSEPVAARSRMKHSESAAEVRTS